jgi:hypothetical protein
MTESIEEWLTQVTSSDYKVWVENPETVKESGFMGKTYITFRVLLKSSDTELIAVRHRFSEFCSLRDILRVRLFIVPLSNLTSFMFRIVMLHMVFLFLLYHKRKLLVQKKKNFSLNECRFLSILCLSLPLSLSS